MNNDLEGDSRLHAIIDGHGKNVLLMTDKEAMAGFLVELVEACGMSVFKEPIVVGYPWPGSTDTTALSAVCFLMESAVVVHTYPEKKFAFVDVFSCQDFDVGKVFGNVKRAFDMPNPKLLLLERGIDHRTGDCVPARLSAAFNDRL
jgi:S-adenosylmethionine decarboxylase